MRRIGLPLILALVLISAACRTNQGNLLEGVWVVVDVKADFDERRVNPSTFSEVISYLKDTRLIIASDSTLTYERGGMVTKSGWHLDAEANKIIIDNEIIGLSSLTRGDSKMFATEKTPLGEVRLVFEKRSR